MRRILCECCKKRKATAIDYMNDDEGWKFACNVCGDNNCSEYYVDFDRLDEPDWIAHLNGKRWFWLWAVQFKEKFAYAKEHLNEKS